MRKEILKRYLTNSLAANLSQRRLFMEQQEKNEESRRKSRKKPKIERRTYGELKMWRGQIVEK